MLRFNRYALLPFVMLVDVCVVGLATVVTVLVEIHSPSWREVLAMRVQVGNILFVLAFLLAAHVAMRLAGFYRSQRLGAGSRDWQMIVPIALLLTAAHQSAGWALGFDYVATPSFLPTFAMFTAIGLAFERQVFRVIAQAVRRHGRNLRRVVIVGETGRIAPLADRLARHAELGYAVDAIVEVPADGATEVDEALDRLLESRPVDEVFSTLPLDTYPRTIRSIVRMCGEQGVTVRMLSALFVPAVGRVTIDEIDGSPVITVFNGPPDSVLLLAKRCLDVGVATVALALTAPVCLLIAAAIKLDSPGPALFAQERVGISGRRFRFYKFRTMVADAERRQEALEARNEAVGPVFKIREDPRITRLGRWLRRSSLDELPQFLNVLRGDMSLVGPRPLPIRDVERFDSRLQRRRFSVKPGMTCLWQVTERTPRFDEWMKTDMEYIDNWSLALDLKILARTIPAVVSGRGAC